METTLETSDPPKGLPFPPLTTQHILHCSFHSWYPRYRSITPKARLISLSQPFLSYLRADGIVLPQDEDEQSQDWSDSDSGIFSGNDNQDDEDEDQPDVSAGWRDVHEAIRSTIAELSGRVVPKLNWSAPKDATWINATNSMECRSANDIYLLLKSSDFVTHDLEHPFDDCVDENGKLMDVQARRQAAREIPYHLILRKWVQLNPSLEFRCFVRRRELIAICQRDLNHFDFLFAMKDKIRSRIQDFFRQQLMRTFPEENFAFDVYIPPPHDRVWLIDINPWAQRTDPLLFSWLELLTMPSSRDFRELDELSITESNANDSDSAGESDEIDEEMLEPVFLLVEKDDPEAYGFTTPQYSAHKLPKDVVDASRGSEGQLREFADQWKEVLERRQREQEEASDSD